MHWKTWFLVWPQNLVKPMFVKWLLNTSNLWKPKLKLNKLTRNFWWHKYFRKKEPKLQVSKFQKVLFVDQFDRFFDGALSAALKSSYIPRRPQQIVKNLPHWKVFFFFSNFVMCSSHVFTNYESTSFFLFYSKVEFFYCDQKMYMCITIYFHKKMTLCGYFKRRQENFREKIRRFGIRENIGYISTLEYPLKFFYPKIVNKMAFLKILNR